MPVSPLRSQSVHDDAFAVEARPRRRRPPVRSRSTRAGLVPAHLALELLFGVALAVVPALLALPLGLAALAAIMGALIAVTAISSPAVRVPIVGSRLHDRLGIDALLVGLAALLWVVGEGGASLLAAAAGVHAALTLLPGRVGARR
jgi:hypothetical protein